MKMTRSMNKKLKKNKVEKGEYERTGRKIQKRREKKEKVNTQKKWERTNEKN